MLHTRTIAAGALMLLAASITQADAEAVIYRFQGDNGSLTDGNAPVGGLTQDAAGNFYGVTAYGGVVGHDVATLGCGTVFRVTPPGVSGPNWSKEILYRFKCGEDGYYPAAAPTIDAAGNLYGTTTQGGSCAIAYGCGGVYELVRTGSGYRIITLHHFRGGTDGYYPTSPLLADANGSLYGTTQLGGHGSARDQLNGGNGTIFRLDHSGSAWVEHVLYRFRGKAAGDGSRPMSGLASDTSGNLYGTTYSGGSSDQGTVYRLTPSISGQWTESVIYSASALDGTYTPRGAVIFDAAGNLYTAAGTVFELSPAPSGPWTFTVISSESGVNNTLLLSPSGVLYGNSSLQNGGLYKFSPTGPGQPWNAEILTAYGMTGDGTTPSGAMILARDGYLYGTTLFGGGTACTDGQYWAFGSPPLGNDGCGVVIRSHQ